ncbi:MAG TPA: DUF58 domain-containing protein [Solirubrobacteraceae bacterium]|nr:DUF58 domain-containing protein [Solirubrobacteraceae bacterium]
MSAGASPTLVSGVVVAVAAALAAVVLGEPALAALGAPFAIAAAAGLTLARDPGVRVTATVAPDRVLEGDEVVVTYDVSAAHGASWLELRARLPGGLAPEPRAGARVLRLGPGAHRSVDVPARATRWGGHLVGGARVRATDGIGAVWFSGVAEAGAAVRVLPGVERLRTMIAPARTQAAVGPRRSRLRGEGLELAEVRPWVSGDHPRRLHWRATARRGAPHVADRHPERSADVLIFLDTFADLRGARESTLTLAVRAAAGLADAHLRTRDRVGVVAFGGVLHWLAPGSGVTHALRITDALASSEVVMSYVARDVSLVPPAVLPARALVIAITPLLDERGARALLDLCARGHDIVIIEIDALALVGERTDAAMRLWALRRAAMRARLAELGATTATWDGVRPLESVLEEVTAFRRASRLAARISS